MTASEMTTRWPMINVPLKSRIEVPVDLRMRADHAFRVGKFSIDARVPSYGYAVSELDLARESQGSVGQDADARAAGPEISAPQYRPQTVGQTQSGNRDQLNEGHRQPR